MRHLLVAFFTAVGICLAHAQEPGVHQSSADVKKELTQVIDSQLAAFRGGDYAKAYGFASAEFRALYSQSDFEGMVRTAYPIIAKSSSADYGDALDSGDDAMVDVHVFSSDKRDAQYRYRLHKDNGNWRINGVIEIKPTGITV